MRGVKSFLKFVLRTILVVLAALLVVKIPQIIVACCGFMIKSDMGYMWVINIAVAFVVAQIVPRFIEAGSEKAYYAIMVCTFAVVTILCESAIWHPSEIGTILIHGISFDKVIYIGVGILASSVTFFIERRRKPPASSAKHHGKYSAPRE